jgi:hypothetical protein
LISPKRCHTCSCHETRVNRLPQGTSLEIKTALSVLVLTSLGLSAEAIPPNENSAIPTAAVHSCSDAVFKFQVNFWVNLHLFLRAEARRRDLNSQAQMTTSSLRDDERATWQASLDGYDGLAKQSLLDDRLVQLGNALAGTADATVLQSDSIDPSIVAALNKAAPIYRRHLWREHRDADERWIDAHCSDIMHFDRGAKALIATVFALKPPPEPILVDIARETGPTLAYTTGGPDGVAGHTVLAPQANSVPDVALGTIFHEISHTMDSQIVGLVDREAARQRIKARPDLWHAITLYTTSEVTRRVLAREGRSTARLEEDLTKLFERNRWQTLLVALRQDWQPYLNHMRSLRNALAKLVRDTSI